MDIIITSHEEDIIDKESFLGLRNCNVFFNSFQPSVNAARMLATSTGESDYIMWLDGDDVISFVGLQAFVDEFLQKRPKLGLYSPISSPRAHGIPHVEPCDLRKSITPKSTHMAFIVKRQYVLDNMRVFEEFIWGDYILRSKLLVESPRDFVRSNVPSFYTWIQKLTSHGRRYSPTIEELRKMYIHVLHLKNNLE